MTVFVQYLPETHDWTGNRALAFGFESIGPIAIEVWMETATAVQDVYNRVLIEPQYYTLVMGGQPPTYTGGIIALAGAIPDTVTRISIERNTPITQVSDYSTEPFRMNNIEGDLDKHTMIIQELSYRKCSATVTGLVTQELEFNPYRVLYKDSLDFAVDKITAYLLEMDTNGEACGTAPTQTGLFETGQIDANGVDIGYAGIYPLWVTT